MIGENADHARNVLADIIALNPLATLDSNLTKLCIDIAQTVSAPDFPGALVPVVNADGGLQINVATPTISNWRRLRPVLLAFAGPTLTSFDGVPEEFDPSDMVGARMKQAQPDVTAIMHLPIERIVRLGALRAILRAVETLSRAPQLQRTAPVPTSWLLARFQDFLNVGRRDAAFGVLQHLSSELRLDALNLKFLEVQLLATFQEWGTIVSLPEFPSLCVARQTPAVTTILLEALYRTHLERAFEANDRDETRRKYEVDVRSFAQSMIRVPAPTSLGAEGWRIYALEASLIPSRVDLRMQLPNHNKDLGWLADILPPLDSVEVKESEVIAPLDSAREALMRVDAVDSNDLVADVMSIVSRLSDQERQLLYETMPFRPILSSVDEMTKVVPPTSWIGWLDRVSEPTFANALDVARHGAEEWEIETSIGDPIAVEALTSALNRTQSNELAAERTTQALPYLVAWLQRDPEYPRAALFPIYSALLTLVALGSARGNSTYESSQILIEALLSAGVDQKTYQELIADVEEIAGDGFGVNMIYWILEIVETFMNAATPDASARETLLHHILARISPIYARLSKLQRTAIGLLSSELGWSLPSLSDVDVAESNESLADRLSGIRIAIYSLTESSSRQAKVALEKIAPTVTVDTNADHGGSPSLRALAENSDLFVMTWLSAKHAATDYIRQHRGDRPLIYARGRGFSSILRAIEEHLSN